MKKSLYFIIGSFNSFASKNVTLTLIMSKKNLNCPPSLKPTTVQWHITILVVQVVVLSLPLFLKILFVLQGPTCGRTRTFALSMPIFKILGILGLLTSHSTLDLFFDGFNHVNISDWFGFLFNHQGSPLLVGGGSQWGTIRGSLV